MLQYYQVTLFNILYNGMIRLIKCERFNTNDDKYLKLVDGMKGAIFKVINHSTVSSSKAERNPPRLPWCGCQMM